MVGAHKLEYNANSGKLLEFVFAIGSVGVDYRISERKLRPALVVVGDNKVNTNRPCIFNLSISGDTCIYGDNKLGAIFLNNVNSGGRNAVALAGSVRNVVIYISALALKIQIQRAYGGNAVNVIISVYGDFFFIVYRPLILVTALSISAIVKGFLSISFFILIKESAETESQ